MIDMIKIPKQIKIAGFIYKVKLVDYLYDESNNLLSGRIKYGEHLIEIATDSCDKQEQIQSLFHEIIHGIIKHYYIEFGEDSDEELICNKFSDAIMAMLLDNDFKVDD